MDRCFHSHAVAVLLCLQVVLGIVTIPLGFRLGDRLVGRDVGLLAAFFLAFDPLAVVQSALVLTEAIYIPLLLLTVCLFIAAISRRTVDRWTLILFLASGSGAGLCALTRSVGLVLPIAMCLALLVCRQKARFKCLALAVVFEASLLIMLPVALQNQARYGHLAISSSGKFNFAALIVGPAKKGVTPNASEDLLGMWSKELGPNYRDLPPFVLADRAASAASVWGKAHPLSLLGSIIKGQVTMLFAPDRSSWAAVLAVLHPSAGVFRVFASALALWRLFISLSAFAAVVLLWKRFRSNPAWFFFALLIAGHMAAAGATGSGRFDAPVAPYLDLLAAFFLLRRGRHHSLPLTGGALRPYAVST